MAYQIPQSVRNIVGSLAEAVFPLETWIAPKAPPRSDLFIPPLGSVPWRPAGGATTLSTAQMEVVRFLELLVDNDSANEALAPRWRQVKADPLKFFQCYSGQSAADWRAGRSGVAATAKFGAFDPDSSNFAFVLVAADGTPTDAVSRREFFEACWAPLVAAHNANPPTDKAGWEQFRDTLRGDASPSWPVSTPVRSSGFIRQFTIDVLNACLGQKNAALATKDPLWQRAVLVEVTENRHPGNAYTVQDAKQAVDAIVKAIASGP